MEEEFYYNISSGPLSGSMSGLNYIGNDVVSGDGSETTRAPRSSETFKEFANHREYSIFFPFERYLSYYALLIMIVGTIFNLISFLVMQRKNLKKYSCMRVLSILALVDTLVLYQWNLNSFYKYNFSQPPDYKDLEDTSIFWCRWITYFAFSSLQLSSWLLTLVSIDRVMIIYSYAWKTQISNKPKRVNLLISLLVVSIMLLNSHIIFLCGYQIPVNLTNATLSKYPNSKPYKIKCHSTPTDQRYIFPKWEKVHLFIYNAIPFAIMLACNSIIIYNIKLGSKVQSKNKSSARRKRHMTIMLMLVTFSFIILTLPSVIVHTFLRDVLQKRAYRRLVNMCVNSLLHTSHAINFFLYVFSAPNFRAEINKILYGRVFCFNKFIKSPGNDWTTATMNRASTVRPNSKRGSAPNANNNNNNNKSEAGNLLLTPNMPRHVPSSVNFDDPSDMAVTPPVRPKSNSKTVQLNVPDD